MDSFDFSDPVSAVEQPVSSPSSPIPISTEVIKKETEDDEVTRMDSGETNVEPNVEVYEEARRISQQTQTVAPVQCPVCAKNGVRRSTRLLKKQQRRLEQEGQRERDLEALRGEDNCQRAITKSRTLRRVGSFSIFTDHTDKLYLRLL